MSHQSTQPCPFCGSTNISDGETLTVDVSGKTSVQSMCNDCGAFGPAANLDEGEIDYGDVKAIAAWNTRAIASVKREPLHSNDLRHLWQKVGGIERGYGPFARAIEQAHGIGAPVDSLTTDSGEKSDADQA